MITGTCRIRLYIKDSRSLKDKRRILSSVKKMTHNRFNVSIAETDCQQSHKECEIGLAVVSNDRDHVQSILSKVKDFIDTFKEIMIIDSETEIW